MAVRRVGAQHAAPLRSSRDAFLAKPHVLRRRHFNSMSCGLACPVARCSKSTSNLESSARPFGVTFTSYTRYGTFPSRFESSELLTYSRLLSGVSFIICACGMATVLTSFGCIGSATSYCCTAPPPNRDTNRNLLSYEIRMSAGSEPSASLITRWKASFPSLPTCQCHTLLPNAQLMNPRRAALLRAEHGDHHTARHGVEGVRTRVARARGEVGDRLDELRVFRIGGDVVNEQAVREQAAPENAIGVGGVAEVVGFVPGRPGRHRGDDLSVTGRRGVGVEHRQEVGVLLIGVAGPDVQHRLVLARGEPPDEYRLVCGAARGGGDHEPHRQDREQKQHGCAGHSVTSSYRRSPRNYA